MPVALELVLVPVLVGADTCLTRPGCGVGLRTHPHFSHSKDAEHPIVRTLTLLPAVPLSWHPAWDPWRSFPSLCHRPLAPTSSTAQILFLTPGLLVIFLVPRTWTVWLCLPSVPLASDLGWDDSNTASNEMHSPPPCLPQLQSKTNFQSSPQRKKKANKQTNEWQQ